MTATNPTTSPPGSTQLTFVLDVDVDATHWVDATEPEVTTTIADLAGAASTESEVI